MVTVITADGCEVKTNIPHSAYLRYEDIEKLKNDKSMRESFLAKLGKSILSVMVLTENSDYTYSNKYDTLNSKFRQTYPDNLKRGYGICGKL